MSHLHNCAASSKCHSNTFLVVMCDICCLLLIIANIIVMYLRNRQIRKCSREWRTVVACMVLGNNAGWIDYCPIVPCDWLPGCCKTS